MVPPMTRKSLFGHPRQKPTDAEATRWDVARRYGADNDSDPSDGGGQFPDIALP